MTDTETVRQEAAGQRAAGGAMLRVVLLHQHPGPDDDQVAELIRKHLVGRGHEVHVDRSQAGTLDWARRVQALIEGADLVVPLLSRESVRDEVLHFEVEVAHEANRQRKGRPVLVPVRVGYTGPLPEPLAAILGALPYQLWEGVETGVGILAELDEVMLRLPEAGGLPVRRSPWLFAVTESAAGKSLEPAGGAVPLGSELYIVRPADRELLEAVGRRDSIVLIKGARQMGKTSLLARGLHAAREQGARVTLTDFQELGAADLENPGTLYMGLAESLVEQLGLAVRPGEVWDPRRSANINFDRFLRREVLSKLDQPLVWGLDEVDRLLVTDYASEVFGLFRSWHNNRALDPAGPWGALTLLISYATEAHLFISDLNQSPFNVGTRLTIDDFTREQVSVLNDRHGHPLRGREELDRFIRLVGGHPYLVRRGLYEITQRRLDVGVFEAKAALDEGIFGDHLRRILMLLARDTDLMEVVRANLLGHGCDHSDAFYRLRSAGVMTGVSPLDMRPRCHIYAAYLRRHLL
jgi:hypothetical protein